jgi:hypothetical protein
MISPGATLAFNSYESTNFSSISLKLARYFYKFKTGTGSPVLEEPVTEE